MCGVILADFNGNISTLKANALSDIPIPLTRILNSSPTICNKKS